MAAHLGEHSSEAPHSAAVGSSDVLGSLTRSIGWAMAVPDRVGLDEEPSRHATHCETAANVFDLVFLSVALVAYTPTLSWPHGSPRTSTQRANAAPGSFLIRQDDGVHDLHRTFMSTSLQFPKASSETGTIAQRIWLSSLSAMTPERPAGARLPFIAIRGWTSR